MMVNHPPSTQPTHSPLGPVAWKLAQFQHVFRLPFVSAEPPKLCVCAQNAPNKKGREADEHLTFVHMLVFVTFFQVITEITSGHWDDFFLREWEDQIVCNLEDKFVIIDFIECSRLISSLKGDHTKVNQRSKKKAKRNGNA